jgi:hypothetical protein
MNCSVDGEAYKALRLHGFGKGYPTGAHDRRPYSKKAHAVIENSRRRIKPEQKDNRCCPETGQAEKAWERQSKSGGRPNYSLPFA